MRMSSWLLAAALSLSMATSALAQFKETKEPDGVQIGGKSEVKRWRVGMILKASGTPCKGIYGYIPVPTEWPEQEVQIVEEDISTCAKVQYEMVDGGVKVMNVHIGQLAANEEAKALVTVEVRRTQILPPENTNDYVLPDPKNLPVGIRRFLTPSPMIESSKKEFHDLAKEVGVDKEHAWERVETIYDWTREHIKYERGNLKGALATLKDGRGDCEGFTSLFIAICRAGDIPARTVWVPGHCYPEFYLNDAKGEGHWFPCQSLSSKGSVREFGGISQLDPIIQKGDNFRPPKNSKERQRFMAEKLVVTAVTKDAQPPQCRFIREPAAAPQ
jgi:hypothetical protein